jgi:hypothetical protein
MVNFKVLSVQGKATFFPPRAMPEFHYHGNEITEFEGFTDSNSVTSTAA